MSTDARARRARRRARPRATTACASLRIAASSAFTAPASKPSRARRRWLRTTSIGDRRAQEADRRADAGARRHQDARDAELLGEPRRRAAARRRRTRSCVQRPSTLPRSIACTRAALAMFSSTISRRRRPRPRARRARAARRLAPERGARRAAGVERDACRRRSASGSMRPSARSASVTVGSLAAAAVAGRAGLGAGAVGADGDAAACASTRAIEPPPAPISTISITGMRTGRPLPFEVAVGARRPRTCARARGSPPSIRQIFGGGAAHVEGQHVGRARTRARCRAARIAPPAGPGLDEADREARRGLERGEPAARHHQEQRAREARGVAARLAGAADSPPSAAARRRWRRWSRSARTRGSPGRPRSRGVTDDAGQRAAQELARALLVRGMGIGVQEADGDRFDAARLRASRRLRATARLVERRAARRRRPSSRSAHVKRSGRGTSGGGRSMYDVVLLEALLVAHLEHVAKALGGEQRGARALALDQRVGGERRAVDEDADVARRERRRPRAPARAVEHAVLGRARRGQHLGGERPPACSSTTSVKVPPISAAMRGAKAC